MHARLYNEAIVDIRLRPRTPLLIKAGSSGEAGLDPTLPDMYFVRTCRPGSSETVYIPGSSFRGVVRGHAERLLRSVSTRYACDPNAHDGRERGGLQPSCGKRLGNTGDRGRGGGDEGGRGREAASRVDGPTAYRRSCYACRLFGNTALASRVRFSDLFPGRADARLDADVRYGVAIDRVTGAVAHGPFEMEVVSGGEFAGTVSLRNFTIGQLGLLGGALLDVADGLVPLGYGKSRGLGRVELEFIRLEVRFLSRGPSAGIPGVGALADAEARSLYGLPAAEADRLDVEVSPERRGPYQVLEARGPQARQWLEKAAPRWVEEVQGA